jgi:predicted NBD/HSP70 family sugar kinase
VSIADITGRAVAEHVYSTRGLTDEDPVVLVRTAVDQAAREAGLTVSDLVHTVVGLPAAVDPKTGGLGYARDLTGWHEDGLLERFREEFGVPIDFENDANLAAVAEQHGGQAAGFGDFVLLWVADGIGMAIVLGGEFWRGASGGAGEVGYMPMPGTPVIRDVSRNQNGGFQSLAGGNAVVRLAEEHHIVTVTAAGGSAAATIVAAATESTDAKSAAFLDELAFRVATGLAVIAAVIDPPLVVLTGATLTAGGERLRDLIGRELRSLAISRPEVRLSSFEGNPVLAGAIRTALRVAREATFARTAD